MLYLLGGLLGTDQRRKYICFLEHCLMFSLLYFYLGLIHIEAMLEANYRRVQH